MRTFTIEDIEDDLRENINDCRYIFTIFSFHLFNFHIDFLREMWKNEEIHQYLIEVLSPSKNHPDNEEYLSGKFGEDFKQFWKEIT